MPGPTHADTSQFAAGHIWQTAATQVAPEKMTIQREFSQFLRTKGYAELICEEYAESNLNLCIEYISREVEGWNSLGVSSPLQVISNGRVVTWRHPHFQEITGLKPLHPDFCDIWEWIKSISSREFLFCCSGMLWCIGCSKIFISDTSGDAGIDLLGIIENGPLRGVVVLVQAKTANDDVNKECVYSDYAKYLLLKHQNKWGEYRRSLDIEKRTDGCSELYLFSSNREFRPSICAAGKELSFMLRSGRQIAQILSLSGNLRQWMRAREEVGGLEASLARDISTPISRVLGPQTV